MDIDSELKMGRSSSIYSRARYVHLRVNDLGKTKKAFLLHPAIGKTVEIVSLKINMIAQILLQFKNFL